MATLGLIGSGSFGAGERPYNFRQMILKLFPNGDAPLTALLSKMNRDEPTDDPRFYWFEKGLPVQRATVRGAVAGTDLPGSSSISANASGAVISLRLQPNGGSADDTSIFKVGHILHNETANENYLVLKKAQSGATDYLIVQRNIGSRYTLGSACPAVTAGASGTGDELEIVGSGFAEGSLVGASIRYQPRMHYNYTQIHRTPIKISRTAVATRLRTDASGPMDELQKEALGIHGRELERAFLFGERSLQTSLTNPDSPLDRTGTGTPLRTTRGITNWLPTATTSSVSVHTNLTSYNSGALTEAIFDSFCESTFRFGSSDKLALCGSTTINVVSQLAKNKMELQAVPTDETYGLAIRRLLTPFGTLNLVMHPLFSANSFRRGEMLVVDTSKLVYRYITDTKYVMNRQHPGEDATVDEFLTEAGLECHFSGATPDTDDTALSNTLDTSAGDCAHGRLYGIATYAG